jgi:dipeptidyl-peptidase-4
VPRRTRFEPGVRLIIRSTQCVPQLGPDRARQPDLERLIDRLIALGKPFEFMLYPNRSHALKEGPGTLHHVYAHLARYLVEHLPPGAR